MRYPLSRRDVDGRNMMPERFNPLADYNAECSRGIVHTLEYDEAMAELQRDFYEWAETRAQRRMVRP